ncbi:MAG: SDR family oxidoreductase [Oligoflexales bacterium]|nr:SDR family oxidoreductase [Oligoflexales bacterium]
MDLSLGGKNALIIAGEWILGADLALSFSREGAGVYLFVERHDIRGSGDEHLDDSINLLKGSLSNPGELVKADDTPFDFNNVDILVFSHQSFPPGSFLQISPETWKIEVIGQLKTACFLTKAAIKGMVERKNGRVIFITSCAGLSGAEHLSSVSTLGTGIIGFCKSLSRELLGYGITVNCISFGLMQFEDAILDDIKKKNRDVLKYTGLKRFETVRDISNGALFLASSRSDYITGQILNISGGLLI